MGMAFLLVPATRRRRAPSQLVVAQMGCVDTRLQNAAKETVRQSVHQRLNAANTVCLGSRTAH
jgi:hypothetical protein